MKPHAAHFSWMNNFNGGGAHDGNQGQRSLPISSRVNATEELYRASASSTQLSLEVMCLESRVAAWWCWGPRLGELGASLRLEEELGSPSPMEC